MHNCIKNRQPCRIALSIVGELAPTRRYCYCVYQNQMFIPIFSDRFFRTANGKLTRWVGEPGTLLQLASPVARGQPVLHANGFIPPRGHTPRLPNVIVSFSILLEHNPINAIA